MSVADAIVVGAGANGLAAAITLARAGRRVVVYEADATIGGSCRSEGLTLPGFVHDVCSSVYPMAVASPFFRTLPLEQHGLEWIQPPAMVAHPLDAGTPAAVIGRSLSETSAGLGEDGESYRRLIGGLAHGWGDLDEWILGPPGVPPLKSAAVRFGFAAMQSAAGLATRRFRSERARALFAGIAAHGMVPLDRLPSGAIGLVLTAVAHAAGWPFPRGGAQRLADALGSYLRSLGGAIITSTPVRSIEELPPARAILCDLSPRPFLRVAGSLLPDRYRRALEGYRYGMAAYKVDFALDGPVPWRDQAVAAAGTVHVGGPLEQIAAAERHVWEGRAPERPFVLVAQPSAFDDTRAPERGATCCGATATCHMPRRRTCCPVSSSKSSASRRAFATASSHGM